MSSKLTHGPTRKQRQTNKNNERNIPTSNASNEQRINNVGNQKNLRDIWRERERESLFYECRFVVSY